MYYVYILNMLISNSFLRLPHIPFLFGYGSHQTESLYLRLYSVELYQSATCINPPLNHGPLPIYEGPAFVRNF